MSVISFEGVQGSSKTTAAVALAYEEHKNNGRRVISNDHLNFDYTHFDIKYFLEHIADGELEDCIILLDEMYQIADSRSSQTNLNKLVTYFAVQTRKRGVDLYLCTHHLDHIDLRLRRAVDIRGACRFYSESPCKKCKCRRCGGKGCDECNQVGGTGEYLEQPCDRCLGYGVTGWSVVHFLDRRLRQRYTMEIFGPRYWHLFSTRERLPIQAKMVQGIDVLEVV